ncbi:MAG: hypothetical protein ACOX3U_00895 [Christensenellales bacterium]
MDNKEQVNSIDAETETQSAEETSLGKFRDSETLLKAYNALEAEFTRRSQKLKELESAEDKADAPLSEPLYNNPEWHNIVQEFVKKNPVAGKFREEIAEEILNDGELSKDKRCLDIALTRILARKYVHPEELISDGDFVDKFVMNNQSIRDRIISEYLEGLNQITPPELIRKKGDIPLSPPNKPKTLKEAGELAAKLFNRR